MLICRIVPAKHTSSSVDEEKHDTGNDDAGNAKTPTNDAEDETRRQSTAPTLANATARTGSSALSTIGIVVQIVVKSHK